MVDRRLIYERVLRLLPGQVRAELEHIALSNRSIVTELNEIRLNSRGLSSLAVRGRRFPISARLGREEAEELVGRLVDGALYAYREQICRGYISLPLGVRVGIGGRASYDGAELRGVSDISSIVFRLPLGECSFADELYRIWREGDGGMLIVAPPSGGKTTALRSLCHRIGSGREASAVVVVDERLEFEAEDYSDTLVTVLSGYRRGAGLELALRTMSAEVLVVDEVVSEADACSLSSVAGAGVRLLASAHGESCSGVAMRQGISELIALGAFSRIVSLGRMNGRFYIKEVRAC